jgi:chemotaxis signal transduction protein
MDTNRANRFLRHMPVVEAYGQRLAALQNVWDSLSLLSQMSGDGTNMGHTREAFESLSGELVKQLSAETSRKAVVELRAKAQVAIDVMVRNLFERTADIGFLCTDDDIVQFMQQATRPAKDSDDDAAQLARAIRKRLQEYVAKYSVYQNVILLAPDGRVLVQLDESNAVTHSCDALIAKALSSTQPYVESYGPTDLVASGEAALLYSYRVEHQQQTLGVLCLYFRFEDETRAIFDKLRAAEDWAVLALLDASGRVIASSDIWQLPLHAPMPLALEEGGQVVRFAGREYLAVTRRTQGYQGYCGPGWLAHAMVPLEHAFEQRSSQVLATIDAELLASVHQSADIFSAELRAIPQRADSIQRELSQSVWNGNVRLAAHNGKENAFSKSLLREISTTGRRSKEVFEQSISDLHETVVSAILHDSRFRASLAVEIMDRNLYERANDCRWWALNGTLQNCLAGRCEASAATGVLEQINNLYTVYDNIILFDRQCQIVATSNPKRRALCGTQLTQAWARETLALRDTQSYGVSAFEPFAGYDGRHTYVFTAAIRGADGRALGGIAIVFDSEPQFAAMLRDVVPNANSGADGEACCAMLLDGQARVIAATSRYKPGDRVEFAVSITKPIKAGAVDIVVLDGSYYAVGARQCGGYREFAGVQATAVVISALCVVQTQSRVALSAYSFTRRSSYGRNTIDLATVACGEHWLAIPSAHIVEAIETAAITRVPGRAAWFSGVTKYQGALLPVIDLAHWVSSSNGPESRAIVVVREGEQLVGLAVDQLGDVLEVASDEIATVDTLHADPRTRLTPQIVRPRDAKDSALLLLDVAALMSMLRPPSLQRSA